MEAEGGRGAGGGTNYPFFILNNKLTYKFFANISIIVLSEVRVVTQTVVSLLDPFPIIIYITY